MKHEFDESTDTLDFIIAVLKNEGFGKKQVLCLSDFLIGFNISIQNVNCDPESIYATIIISLQKSVTINRILYREPDIEKDSVDWFLDLEPVKRGEFWGSIFSGELWSILEPGF